MGSSWQDGEQLAGWGVAGGMLACTVRTKLWVLSLALCKLGMVVDTRNTNTGEVEATDQGFKII